MEYTKNYHLPQWVKEDRIQMEDFNQMCADIEAGITEAKTAGDALPYVVGSYTGDGTTNVLEVNLGFRPRFVIITGQSRGTSEGTESLARFAIVGGDVDADIVSLLNAGFRVNNNSYKYPQMNMNGKRYHYIAFK